MISVNELRVGNWFNNQGTHEQVTVNVIEALLESSPRLWIKPIEITPDRLERCGFAIISNPNYTDSFLCYKPLLKLVLDAKTKSITLRDYSGIQQSIEYLHQLQNLYFALTGEELIYKP